MHEIIINIMNSFGYLGVLLLIAIENIFPPIPSEVILTFGGFMTSFTDMTVLGVIIVSTIGSLLGAILLYFIGKILNKNRLKKIVNGKVGKVLRLKEKDIDMADDWFTKKGTKTVFFCRFVPILRSLISIPAGMNCMNITKFLIYTIIGSLIWNSVLVVLGSILGENWLTIVDIFDTYSKITLITLILLFVVFIFFYIKKRKRK